MRLLILMLSGLYGLCVVWGAGILTGGGHAALFLGPLMLGPVAYIPNFFTDPFHDPQTGLVFYAGVVDITISLLAMLGWPLAASLAVWRATWCFRIVMASYYLWIVADWIYQSFNERFFFKVVSAPHLMMVIIYMAFFLGGQIGLWFIHHRFLLTPPPNRSLSTFPKATLR